MPKYKSNFELVNQPNLWVIQGNEEQLMKLQAEFTYYKVNELNESLNHYSAKLM
jgi:hypothetical protein